MCIALVLCHVYCFLKVWITLQLGSDLLLFTPLLYSSFFLLPSSFFTVFFFSFSSLCIASLHSGLRHPLNPQWKLKSRNTSFYSQKRKAEATYSLIRKIRRCKYMQLIDKEKNQCRVLLYQVYVQSTSHRNSKSLYSSTKYGRPQETFPSIWRHFNPIY